MFYGIKCHRVSLSSCVNMRFRFNYFVISECVDHQAPRFITPPSASGSIVAEGRTKILQCQAVGENLKIKTFSAFRKFEIATLLRQRTLL